MNDVEQMLCDEIERHKLTRAALEKAVVVPKPAQLQIPHFCCGCGRELETGTFQMCAVVPLQRGSIQTIQRIAWCEGCWGEMPFAKDEAAPVWAGRWMKIEIED